MQNTNQKILFKLVSDILNIDINNINNNSNAEQFDTWDSLGNVRLILGIEKEFNIKISFSETIIIDNIGDLLTLIESKINK